MAREMVAWCDCCLEQKNEHTAAGEIRIGIDGQWWSTDLCSTCAADLVDPLAYLVQAHGVRQQLGSPAQQVKASTGTQTSASSIDPPDFMPSSIAVESHRLNLQRRERGVRLGRKPAKPQTPCIFCGLEQNNGLSSAHAQLHGFSTVKRALGGLCPWCGEEFAALSNHMQRAHPDKLKGRTMNLTFELILAHLQKAPFDVLPALRERAYNVEPLDVVLRKFNA